MSAGQYTPGSDGRQELGAGVPSDGRPAGQYSNAPSYRAAAGGARILQLRANAHRARAGQRR